MDGEGIRSLPTVRGNVAVFFCRTDRARKLIRSRSAARHSAVSATAAVMVRQNPGLEGGGGVQWRRLWCGHKERWCLCGEGEAAEGRRGAGRDSHGGRTLAAPGWAEPGWAL